MSTNFVAILKQKGLFPYHHFIIYHNRSFESQSYTLRLRLDGHDSYLLGHDQSCLSLLACTAFRSNMLILTSASPCQIIFIYGISTYHHPSATQLETFGTIVTSSGLSHMYIFLLLTGYSPFLWKRKSVFAAKLRFRSRHS